MCAAGSVAIYCMAHNITVYRIVEEAQLELIWAYCVQRGLYMYKEKDLGWVVWIPNTHVKTGFLLLYSNSVESLMGTQFV